MIHAMIHAMMKKCRDAGYDRSLDRADYRYREVEPMGYHIPNTIPNTALSTLPSTLKIRKWHRDGFEQSGSNAMMALWSNIHPTGDKARRRHSVCATRWTHRAA